jgi:two-component system chemotaxis response regulator CheB
MSWSLAGRLPDFDLPQILSVLEVSRATGRLNVSSSEGEGALLLSDGSVVGAESPSNSGELAAFEVLSWSEGEFWFIQDAAPARRQIDRSNQGLCLEAMRLIDESRSPDVAFVRSEAGDASVPHGARAVLDALNGSGVTVEAVAHQVGLPPVSVLYWLEALERLRVVRRLTESEELCDEAGAATTRMLLVDDSRLMQKVLRRMYESDGDIEVVGVAENGEEALALLPELKPDVISLDLYMPVMDGVTTLKRIMLSQPTPTVIVTSANADELDLTFESILRFGAIDFITKPSKSRGEMGDQTVNILERIRKASRVNLRGVRMVQPAPHGPHERADRSRCRGLLVATGGTGGCLSYLQLLTSLPTDLPFAVIGQLSFPRDFTRGLASYLRKSARVEVQLAEDGVEIEGGVAYLASDADRVRIEPGESRPLLRVESTDEPADPSLLFREAAASFNDRSIGLVLSGSDQGALPGLGAIGAAGGTCLGQLPESCVDPEPVETALRMGLVERVVLLPHISHELSQAWLSRLRSGTEEEASWPRKTA